MTIFLLSLAINIVWEYSHAFLYIKIAYVTAQWFTLPAAAISDALYVTVIFYIFKKQRIWLCAIVALVLSVIIELLAINLGWWGYKEAMPVIPYLNTGLSPTIQLAGTVYLVYFIKKKLKIEKTIFFTINKTGVSAIQKAKYSPKDSRLSGKIADKL